MFKNTFQVTWLSCTLIKSLHRCCGVHCWIPPLLSLRMLLLDRAYMPTAMYNPDCKNHNYEQQSYCQVQSERRMMDGHWPESTVDSFNSGCTNVRCGGTATRLR